MISDHARARISAALLVAGTLTGVVFAIGPVVVVREAMEQHGVSVDGSAVLAPAFLSAVAALVVSLAGWHRSFVGSESWTTRTRSHQVAGLAVLAPVLALALAVTWSLVASRPEYPASALIAATVWPLVPGVAAASLGVLIAAVAQTADLRLRRRLARTRTASDSRSRAGLFRVDIPVHMPVRSQPNAETSSAGQRRVTGG